MPKSSKKAVSLSKRAGLQMPVRRVLTQMKNHSSRPRTGFGAPIYMAAVVEYLMAEILELAGNAARDNKRIRVKPRDIQLALCNDEELNALVKSCSSHYIASGGSIPYIHDALLPKKHKKGGEESE